LLSAACIHLGLCLIAFGGVWHFSHDRVDNDYVYYRVEIKNPKDLTALLPIWITTDASSPFKDVDP